MEKNVSFQSMLSSVIVLIYVLRNLPQVNAQETLTCRPLVCCFIGQKKNCTGVTGRTMTTDSTWIQGFTKSQPEVLEQPVVAFSKPEATNKVDEKAWLLFANRHDIRKLDLDVMTMKTVVSELQSAIAVDYDYNNKQVFWSDSNEEKIMKANMSTKGEVNGTGIPFISIGLKTIDGIAVDWIYHNIYWTDPGETTIEVASADGSMRKILVDTDLNKPRAIAVDPRNGWLYFSDWGYPPKIERIGMDGNIYSRTTIVNKNIKWPNGLCLDYDNKKLYWIDAKLKSIFNAELDGSNIRRILQNAAQIDHPFSLTVFEKYVYWTDWSLMAIYKVHKITGEQYTQLASGLRSPMDIKVYHKQRQLQSPNKCGLFNGGCSHMCLPTPTEYNVNGFSCICPDNIVHNRKQCKADAPRQAESSSPNSSSETDNPKITTRKTSTSYYLNVTDDYAVKDRSHILESSSNSVSTRKAPRQAESSSPNSSSETDNPKITTRKTSTSYCGYDGDLSVRCTALTASTTGSTTTSKSTSTTSTSTSTTTILKSILTTTTPSIHSRSTSFVEPSKEAIVTINMNTDVIKNSKETTSASFSSPTMKATPDDSQKWIYIIAGLATGGVVLLIGIIMCILALKKRDKIERTKDKSTEEDSAPTNENADSSNAFRENPLYVSYDKVEDIRFTEEDKQQGDRYSSATDLECNRWTFY